MPQVTIRNEDVAAERRYLIGDDGEEAFIVRLSKAVQVEPYQYKCFFSVSGRFENWSGWTIGIDGIDAMKSALLMLAVNVHFINEREFGGRLRCDASTEADPLGIGSEALERLGADGEIPP
jgi:hypothetical protein